MRYIWSRLIIFFLLAEVLGFSMYYVYGPTGMHGLSSLKQAKIATLAALEKIEQENVSLQEEIEEWQTAFFLQEKFARERLAMQKEHEIIYYR